MLGRSVAAAWSRGTTVRRRVSRPALVVQSMPDRWLRWAQMNRLPADSISLCLMSLAATVTLMVVCRHATRRSKRRTASMWTACDGISQSSRPDWV